MELLELYVCCCLEQINFGSGLYSGNASIAFLHIRRKKRSFSDHTVFGKGVASCNYGATGDAMTNRVITRKIALVLFFCGI